MIIGGGPAGLTAAVYAATLKMEALLVATDLGGQAVEPFPALLPCIANVIRLI